MWIQKDISENFLLTFVATVEAYFILVHMNFYATLYFYFPTLKIDAK